MGARDRVAADCVEGRTLEIRNFQSAHFRCQSGLKSKFPPGTKVIIILQFFFTIYIHILLSTSVSTE